MNFFRAHKRVIGFVLIAFCLLGVLSVATRSTSFKQCKSDRTSDYASYGNPDFFENVDTFFVCEGVTGDANGELLTALATIAVAAFTWTLYLATTEQGRLTQQSIDLATKEFIATHRPKIIVRSFEVNNREMNDGEAVQPFYIAQNIGETPAHIWEINDHTIISAPHALRGDIPLDHRTGYDISLAGGEPEMFLMDDTCVPIGGQSMRSFAGEVSVYCIGRIRYRDDNGTERETGFIRRWDSRLNIWHPIEGSDYEYAF